MPLKQNIRIMMLILVLLGAGACSSSEVFVPTQGSGSEVLVPTQTPQPVEFDGQRAFQDVEYQVSLGPRTPGSQGHAQAVDWIVDQLQAAGWSAEVQETTYLGHPIRNIIGGWGEGSSWILIGAHYDTRLVADQDPDPQKRSLPVPGANDGGSGVAVLLELARVLPSHFERETSGGPGTVPKISLVFFDAEDNGNLPGLNWIMGSRAFVAELDEKPDAAVIVDMIGDADLNIYQERNSDPNLTDEIWKTASELGYAGQFIAEPKYSMIDDHTPFIEAGIPAVDLIDFDYPYWHTTADTPDKVSARSLQIVGDTLIAWLTNRDIIDR